MKKELNLLISKVFSWKMAVTWWADDGKSETRKYLYKLEGLNIVCQEKEKTEYGYKFKWKLTEEGERLVGLSKNLTKYGLKGR